MMDSTRSGLPKPPPITPPTGSQGKGSAPHQSLVAGDRTAGGEDRRRSQRVLLRVAAKVHVVLDGTPAAHLVTTLSVNAHGALIVMKQNLPAGTPLVLEHSGTKDRVACKVVRPSRDTPEGFHTALEFDSSSPDFWRIAFPPSSWRPGDA